MIIGIGFAIMMAAGASPAESTSADSNRQSSATAWVEHHVMGIFDSLLPLEALEARTPDLETRWRVLGRFGGPSAPETLFSIVNHLGVIKVHLIEPVHGSRTIVWQAIEEKTKDPTLSVEQLRPRLRLVETQSSSSDCPALVAIKQQYESLHISPLLSKGLYVDGWGYYLRTFSAMGQSRMELSISGPPAPVGSEHPAGELLNWVHLATDQIRHCGTAPGS